MNNHREFLQKALQAENCILLYIYSINILVFSFFVLPILKTCMGKIFFEDITILLRIIIPLFLLEILIRLCSKILKDFLLYMIFLRFLLNQV